MVPILLKFAVAAAGLVIFGGLYIGGPTSRLRHVTIFFGLVILAAFLFTAIDHFHLTP
jgi:hypothetical protein